MSFVGLSFGAWAIEEEHGRSTFLFDVPADTRARREGRHCPDIQLTRH